ncbi:MAG: OadG family protein [Clostridiales bacterium]|nr:OadG family protein [Clostridiales bacterium]
MLLALSVAQKFSTGSITFLIGIITTFVVLAILVVFVILMNYFNKVDTKKIMRKKEKTQDITTLDTNKVAKEQEIDKQTLEAIHAAVEVFMTNSDATLHQRYTIRSIKKISKEEA